jgi:hypothetical protein
MSRFRTGGRSLKIRLRVINHNLSTTTHPDIHDYIWPSLRGVSVGSRHLGRLTRVSAKAVLLYLRSGTSPQLIYGRELRAELSDAAFVLWFVHLRRFLCVVGRVGILRHTPQREERIKVNWGGFFFFATFSLCIFRCGTHL